LEIVVVEGGGATDAILLAKRVGARISITDLIFARHVDDPIYICLNSDGSGLSGLISNG